MHISATAKGTHYMHKTLQLLKHRYTAVQIKHCLTCLDHLCECCTNIVNVQLLSRETALPAVWMSCAGRQPGDSHSLPPQGQATVSAYQEQVDT